MLVSCSAKAGGGRWMGQCSLVPTSPRYPAWCPYNEKPPEGGPPYRNLDGRAVSRTSAPRSRPSGGKEKGSAPSHCRGGPALPVPVCYPRRNFPGVYMAGNCRLGTQRPHRAITETTFPFAI